MSETVNTSEIVKIFQSEGILKKSKQEIEEETVLFDGVACAMSVYLRDIDGFGWHCFNIYGSTLVVL